MSATQAIITDLSREASLPHTDKGLQRLYINENLAQRMLKDPKAKEFISEKLRSAQWLIRAIEQRRRTIIKVTECIVEKQKEFLEKGVGYLKPMILRDVAETVGMHESTISRVTSNKYVHTPQGLFELKYFFNSSIRRVAEEDIVFAGELDDLTQARDAVLHYVVGDHATPAGARLLTPDHLEELVPDIAERDVFVCGPPAMTDHAVRHVRAAGVPSRFIHAERFAL